MGWVCCFVLFACLIDCLFVSPEVCVIATPKCDLFSLSQLIGLFPLDWVKAERNHNLLLDHFLSGDWTNNPWYLLWTLYLRISLKRFLFTCFLPNYHAILIAWTSSSPEFLPLLETLSTLWKNPTIKVASTQHSLPFCLLSISISTSTLPGDRPLGAESIILFTSQSWTKRTLVKNIINLILSFIVFPGLHEVTYLCLLQILPFMVYPVLCK